MAEHVTPPGGEERAPDVESAAPLLEWRKRKAEMLMKTRERREFSTSGFELREAPDGVLRFSGYASVTDTPYEVGFFTETIQRGAFKRTLAQEPDVQLLINHGEGGSGMPIARTGKNMTLVEDERGLRVDAELDTEDPDVILLARKMRRGLIDQMSFAFQVPEGEQEWDEDFTQRTIRSVNIHRGDVSVVNQGANGGSVAVMRSRDMLVASGAEGLLTGLVEWRERSLLPVEERGGPPDVLSALASLVSGSEEEAQALVVELMRVPVLGERSAEAEEAPVKPALSPRERQSQYLRRRAQEQRAAAIRKGA